MLASQTRPQRGHLMNTYARMPVRIVRGRGAYLYDDQGREYLDALSGIGVCSLGHAHPELAEAIAEQARTLVHVANIAHLPVQEALADRLAEVTGMDQAFFCNSGAEATECCFKLARLHGHQRGIAAPQIVVVSQSFHGRTLACLSATDSRKVQAGFEPLVPGFLRVPFDDPGALARLAAEREDIAAVLVEPILGEGGVVTPQPGYLTELRRICDQHDWLLIADEVQTGIGKTGAWLAVQHEGVLPDVVALAKALGNGVPIGACLARDRVAGLFAPGRHGSTYGGNPLACRAGLTVLEIMQRERVLAHCRRMGEALRGRLEGELAGDERVVEVRGRGLMIGVQLARPCGELVARALERGMIMNVTRENTIRLLPPLIIGPREVERIAETVLGLIRSDQGAAA